MFLIPFSPAFLSISIDATETIIRSVRAFVEGRRDIWCEFYEGIDASLRICDQRGRKIELIGCNVLQDNGNVDLLYIGLTWRRLPDNNYFIDTIVQARIDGWYEGDDDDDDSDDGDESDTATDFDTDRKPVPDELRGQMFDRVEHGVRVIGFYTDPDHD